MKYILFVIMLTGDITSAEFDSKPACQAASIAVFDNAATMRVGDAVGVAYCVPKGNE